MELGQRIRQARQAAGLSQRQLCGEEITRNMLSLIENGTARPSMDTLCYLAQRLGKPVSWFLAESATPNQDCMAQARECYIQKEYTLALAALDCFQLPDALLEKEYRLLYALAAMGGALQVLAEGKAVYAAQLLEKAWASGQQTPYFGEALQRQWVLTMYKTGQGDPKELSARLPKDPAELLLQAEAAASPEAQVCLLDAVQHRDHRWQLLRGLAALQLKDYETATACLHGAEEDYPRQAIPALEQCYREQENYKQAYLYACKLRQL